MSLQEALDREKTRQNSARPKIGLSAFCALLGLTLLLTAWPAAAAELGFFEARRIHKQADQALESGDADKAAELYRQLADGLDRNHKRRAEALYGAALASLETQDRDGAAAHIEELLQVFPRHDRSVDAKTLKALLEYEEPAPEPAPEPEPEPEPEPAPPVVDDKRIRQLEARVARLQGELKAAREELQKKEEAIEKLKELVVGEGG